VPVIASKSKFSGVKRPEQATKIASSLPKKGKSGFSSHEICENTTHVWLTPEWVLSPLGKFDLDPCAATTRPWPTAARHLTVAEDGLSQAWPQNERVFLNCPYDDAPSWFRKMAEHGNGIALIFTRTDTAWWSRWVTPYASAFLFLEGRLKFCREDGQASGGSAGAPSVLIGYGQANAQTLRTCGLKGTYLEPLRNHLAMGAHN
jgi:hypothetical protein